MRDSDPADLAKLYDLLVHQEAPRGATPAHRACAGTQQLVRRAIEAHPHFREIGATWQAFNARHRLGYAGYLPSLVAAV